MIRVDISTLITKLNSQTKLALEQASELCIERQEPEVMLTHLFYTLLDNPTSDLRLLLDYCQIDHHQFKQQLGNSFSRTALHDTYPSFSPMLVELLQDAWLFSSTELSSMDVRSGSLFITALSQAQRYLPTELINLFAQINREDITRNFYHITAKSTEAPANNETQSTRPAAAQSDASGLSKYCHNISLQAQKAELDPVLCRDDEINLMIDILCRRRKNNPIIVGDAGVGKSALIEGLANRIEQDQVPDKLKGVQIWSLDLGLLQAGAAVKGEFEKRLKGIIEHIKSAAQPIMLFIDEAHTLIGAGNLEGGGDAANLLKPALARGELQTVAATTWKEYKKYIEKDPALARRFQLVKLDEPTTSQATEILRGLHPVYEKAHGVIITDQALRAAVELSARYLSGRQLPDKAIDVLDTACARIAINLTAPPAKLARLEGEIYQKTLELDLLVRQHKLGGDMDESRQSDLLASQSLLQQQQQLLLADWQQQQQKVTELLQSRQEILADKAMTADISRAKLNVLQQQLNALQAQQKLVHIEVNQEQVAQVIADWTGIPVDKMSKDEVQKIRNLPESLTKVIKGQSVAINEIHKHLLTARADLRRAGRPRGAFLLVGPSGVGKTETVVQISEILYGGKQFLTTINMSEYQEKHTVSRLIGSPPGYVGYGEGGLLTEAIRKMPYSVVLLDEVEKAHPDVLNLFYQAFDKGELADGEGRLIDCKNVLFFMTSNLGYQSIVEHSDDPEKLALALYPQLSEFFKPALLARMETVPFLPLNESVLEQIVTAKLARLEDIFTERYQASVKIGSELISHIMALANRSENGARILESIIDGQVLPSVSLALLDKLAEGSAIEQVHIFVRDAQFSCQVS
jgi:type VI secretion system protein VasG